jgi:hypothetical protein
MIIAENGKGIFMIELGGYCAPRPWQKELPFWLRLRRHITVPTRDTAWRWAAWVVAFHPEND